MSKGSTLYPVRMPKELEEKVFQAIEDRNKLTTVEPWTFSEFVRSAIREKLNHMQRSRKQYGKRKKAPVMTEAEQEQIMSKLEAVYGRRGEVGD